MPEDRDISIPLPDGRTVSGLLTLPEGAPVAGYVLAHGAGAGMRQPFLAAVARGLAARGIATLRYQFLYMEEKRGRPDAKPAAIAVVRAAVEAASGLLPGVPLMAGGKSFGGRMTSEAESASPLGVAGLAFLGFPLHPPGKVSDERAAHLAGVGVPMLFLQGTRDEFAKLDLLREVIGQLGGLATLHLIEDGDHSFKVRAASGRNTAAALEEVIEALAAWIVAAVAEKPARPSRPGR